MSAMIEDQCADWTDAIAAVGAEMRIAADKSAAEAARWRKLWRESERRERVQHAVVGLLVGELTAALEEVDRLRRDCAYFEATVPGKVAKTLTTQKRAARAAGMVL